MAEVGQVSCSSFSRRRSQWPSCATARFVFERPFGMADKDVQLQTSPTTLFRIASATKPITSVAIFTLVEQGKLNLTDKVFGPSGVLGNTYGKPPYKQYVTDITVDDLLTHTSRRLAQRLHRSHVSLQVMGPGKADLLDAREPAAYLSSWTALGLLQFRLLRARPRHRKGQRASLTKTTCSRRCSRRAASPTCRLPGTP